MMLNIHSYALKSADTQHKQHGETNNDQDHLRKMFIGGLSAITNEDSLRTFFSKWGEVVDAVVMRDPGTKRSRGFGFITYSAQTMVDKAQASRPHVIDNKTVDTKRALPRPEVSKGEANTSVKKIFVGGLKENHDAQALQDHFSIFGHVVNVKILTDKTTGRKRGFAFVEFDDYDAVDKAVLQKTHIVNGVPVDVKKSNYKQELAKKIAQQQQGGVISNVGALPASYQAYNTPTYAAYPTQIPTAVNPYNGWAGYAQPGATAAGYAQAALTPAYGAYGAQANGASWNGTAAYGAWAPNGYASAAGANAVAAATTPAGVAASNGWNPNGAAQNFGDYQQVYNGGPQKAGNLQTNRVNPYNVGAGPSYGNTTTRMQKMNCPNLLPPFSYTLSQNIILCAQPVNLI